jgi:CDGSH-type Zn-finger protein
MVLDKLLIFDLTTSMRKVLKSDQGPLEIKPQDKSVWICMCGLTMNEPYCDGSHKKTRDEENGKTYEYDQDGHRRELS